MWVSDALSAGASQQWPVGIRHHRELCSRSGNACDPKSEEETMEHIARELCKICCGNSWEERYATGWNKLLVSIWGKLVLAAIDLLHTLLGK
jgi:hypothetical protein